MDFKSKLDQVGKKKPAKKIDKPAPPPPAKSAVADAISDSMKSSRQDSSVQFVELALIDTEEQVRDDLRKDHILDLAGQFRNSKTKQPDQPITLWKKDNGRYLLETGEHRFRAQEYNYENHGEEYALIRATIQAEPAPTSKADRNRLRARENLHREDLTDIELGRAVQEYKDEYPDKTQQEIASDFGFTNLNTGASKISRILSFLDKEEEYPEIIEKVEKGDLAISAAQKEIKEAEREKKKAKLNPQTDEPEKPKEKKPKTKGKSTYSIDHDKAVDLCYVLQKAADDLDIETINFDPKKLDRKQFIDILNNRLPDIIENLKG